MENLLDHFIYVFRALKNILTDQGTNFMSELIKNFENLFRMKHVETTTYHPQTNGNLKKVRSVLKDLLRTCIEDIRAEWDIVLKINTLDCNTISPFQVTLGRENANVPSTLATNPNLKCQDLLDLWKQRHEKYLRKGKERLQLHCTFKF